MRQQSLSHVVESVRTGLELYRRLLRRQRKKMKLVAAGDDEALEALCAREMRTVAEIQRCQQRLGSLLEGQALKDYIGSLRDSERSFLEDLARRLEETVAESARVNLRNLRFLQKSMVFGRAMLEQVYGIEPQYDSRGHLKAAGLGAKTQGFSY